MSKYAMYTNVQEVAATHVDLEFAWDVAELIEFLDDYKINYRFGNIPEPEEQSPSHKHVQNYYVELLGDPWIDDEGNEQRWIHVQYDHHIVVLPKTDSRKQAITILTAEEFKKTYAQVTFDS